MASKVPTKAIIFMAHTASMAGKYGLKKAATKAAGKVNPAFMVIEAAISVADAVNSYLKLKNARARRDGLQDFIPLESERLRLEREELLEQISLAQEQIGDKVEIQKRLALLALACGKVVRSAWDELYAIRKADLPDFQQFDDKLEDLEDVWVDFKRALYNFYES